MSACGKCGKPGHAIPLHGDRGGPLFCYMCAGAWHAEHGRRRKLGRIVIKALKLWLDAGGRYNDIDKLKLAASGLSLPGYEADTIGTEVGDISSELLADALQLTHPDRHPVERKEMANRVTQDQLALKPFVFPAPKAKPTVSVPPSDTTAKSPRATLDDALRGITFPCADCTDTVPYYYCDPCRAEWDKRQRQEREARNARQRRWYARRRQRRILRSSPTMCAVCGNGFEPNRTDAKHCSPACRQKAYRRRVTENKGSEARPAISRHGAAGSEARP